MHDELRLSASTLIAFALVLCRMAGVFVFVPLPGKDAGPNAPRIFLALACTIALFPRWPAIPGQEIGLATMAAWLVSELGLGIAIGLMVGFVAEALTLGAQILSVQAGYGYASVIDPTTQADSDVLAVMAQLMAGLLFFTTGLHRFVIGAFAASLDAYPPGTFQVTRDMAAAVLQLGSTVFAVGLRLAFPILALLLMAELALGLLGRLNSQLHLSMHAVPAKMLLTLLALTVVLASAPSLYQALSGSVMLVIRQKFAH